MNWRILPIATIVFLATALSTVSADSLQTITIDPESLRFVNLRYVHGEWFLVIDQMIDKNGTAELGQTLVSASAEQITDIYHYIWLECRIKGKENQVLTGRERLIGFVQDDKKNEWLLPKRAWRIRFEPPNIKEVTDKSVVCHNPYLLTP